MTYSYTCGGVGHLSRDCVQGSKCYNCSGSVRVSTFSYRGLCGVNDARLVIQGHISRDCPQPQRRACYTCGSEGWVTQLLSPWAHKRRLTATFVTDTATSRVTAPAQLQRRGRELHMGGED